MNMKRVNHSMETADCETVTSSSQNMLLYLSNICAPLGLARHGPRSCIFTAANRLIVEIDNHPEHPGFSLVRFPPGHKMD